MVSDTTLTIRPSLVCWRRRRDDLNGWELGTVSWTTGGRCRRSSPADL